MAELALKQATIEYQEFGPQDSVHPPVFFVHGVLVNGELWRGVAEELARRGYRCIVPTLPLGSHTIPVKDAGVLSLPGVAEIVNDAIAALDLSDVTLVGSDTGGGICQLAVDARSDRIGRLVLTNCDAFDQCPPFPFDVVFSLLRGPISIKALMGPMRLAALRNSALGFGLLISRPDNHLTADWIAPCLNDARICRDLAALLRQIAVTDLTDVADAAAPVRQAGDAGLGPGRSGVQTEPGPAAGRGVQQRETDRGAGCKDLCLASTNPGAVIDAIAGLAAGDLRPGGVQRVVPQQLRPGLELGRFGDIAGHQRGGSRLGLRRCLGHVAAVERRLRVVFHRQLDDLRAVLTADLAGQPERQVDARRHPCTGDDLAFVHHPFIANGVGAQTLSAWEGPPNARWHVCR